MISMRAHMLLLAMGQQLIRLAVSLFHQVEVAVAASLVVVEAEEEVLFKKCLYSLT